MRIHYVEDNERDAKALSEMIGLDGGIQLAISERIDDFASLSGAAPTDFVLLDVRRPDAVSIKDDITRVRRLTDAPIVFVTGDNAETLRNEAMSGGAEAVIDKSDLNKNLLRQLMLNATHRHRLASKVSEEKLSSKEIKASIDAMAGPFTYIELSLQTLLETMEDSGRTASADYVSHMLDTVRAIRAYSQDDLSKATRTPIHELLVETAERVSRTAKNRKIDLVMETETSWFTQVGSQPLASLGVQHLIAGLMRACEPGDRMSVRGERDEDGIALSIFMSRAVLSSANELFDLTKASPSLGLDSKASIQLALTLLSLTREQVDVHVHKGNLFVKVRI